MRAMAGRRSRDTSVARQILVLQVGVVLVLVVASLALAAYDARRDARDEATTRAVSVAETVADSPAVLEALASGESVAARSAALQPYAEDVRMDTDVDFVVVMGLDRIRYTHPNPDNIGKPFVGDLGRAPQGEVFTQEFKAPSARRCERWCRSSTATRSWRWSPSASRSTRSTVSCVATCCRSRSLRSPCSLSGCSAPGW